MSGTTDHQKLQTALALHQKGNLNEAANLYRQLIKRKPDNFHALHFLGIIEATVGNIEQAKLLMARSLSIRPPNIQFIENYATMLFKSGDYRSTIQVCQQGLQLNKNSISLLYKSAVALFMLNKFKESITQFDKLLFLQPKHIAALNERGSALAEMCQYEAALASIEKALALNKQYAEAHLNKGNVYGKLKRHDEALRTYDEALCLNPSLANAWLGRGNIFWETKCYDEALAAYDKALSLRPDLAHAWLGRGSVFLELRRYSEALAAYDKALSLNLAEAWPGRGHVLTELARYDDALAAYDKALSIKPDLENAWFGRGNVFKELKRYDDALAAYDKALALKSDRAEVFNNRGLVLERLERFEEALASYDKAIALKSDFAEAFTNRGLALEDLKRFEEALASYDKAIALKLDAAAFGNRGNTLLTLGRLEEATESFERATALEPKEVKYHLSLIISRRVTAADPHFAVMKELAREEESLDVERKIELHFGLGKALADLGDCKQSFHHLLKANSLKRQQLDYNETKTLDLFDRIRAVFTAELLREKGGLGDPSRLPVFVVGMPRSGTTLVEQILASHPSIFGAGELREFSSLAKSIRTPNLREFPEAVATMSGAELRALGARFLQMIQQMAPAAARITDKMPGNFRYAGLIHLALPNARIIHVGRNPRDIALSCFSLLFLKDRLPFTYNLPELGRYIRAYQALMKHWREVLPCGVMLEVQYEEVVDNLAEQAQRIVAHCGLPWDAACLEFHKTDRAVRTASVTQVRRPIYRSSMGRWRDYEEFLQPLLRELEHHPA
jgi:tetratricopeptide (TPR) repeat protein